MGAAVGAAIRGGLSFLPSLAAMTSVAAPAEAVLGSPGGGALNAVKELASAKAEPHASLPPMHARRGQGAEIALPCFLTLTVGVP